MIARLFQIITRAREIAFLDFGGRPSQKFEKLLAVVIVNSFFDDDRPSNCICFHHCDEVVAVDFDKKIVVV